MYPREIEEVLYEHPAVAEAAVVGVPHPELGQEVARTWCSPPVRTPRTGDLARRDAAGNYYIVDRTKDMILRGGLNVYPREIEEVLYEHPAVAEAAVVGVPHPELG
ncbi:hypothetical protein D9C01_13200, partial [Corynebacterium diphtheriae]